MIAMMNVALAATKQAVADRKAVTALEYALIAGAVAAILLAGFQGLFNNIVTYLTGITFGAAGP